MNMNIVELGDSPGKPPTTQNENKNDRWVINGRTYVMHTIILQSTNPTQSSSPSSSSSESAISCLLNPDLIPLLPTPTPAAHPPLPNPPFIIKPTTHKGLAQFASRDIPAGALVLVDHPALILPAGRFPPEVYEELGRRLPERRRRELMGLSNCRAKEEEGEVEGIVRTNALQLELDLRGKVGWEEREVYGGVYPLLNRGNHSCGPNVGVQWNLANLTLSLYALRPIRKGEEILKTYLDPALPRAARMALLQKNYRFRCDCPWCNVRKARGAVEGEDDNSNENANENENDKDKNKDTANDTDNLTPAELQLIAESDHRRALLGTWVSRHLSYKKWHTDLARPDDLIITSHLEALSLIEQEGMHGMQLLFIEELALCYASLGNVEEFKRWGGRVVELAEVVDPLMKKRFEEWMGDPERRMKKKWAWRKRQRENAPGKSKQLKAGQVAVEPLFPVDAFHMLFQFPD